MYDLLLLVVGLLAIAAVALPLLLREHLITFPIVIVAVGALLGVVAPEGTFDPVERGFVSEHLSEFAVIIALTGLGLSIDRRVSWRGWMTTWRLLAFTMPLSIVASAWLGWWVAGLAPAAAVLFGAALAPTDPVLAVDVQTGPPTTGEHDADEPDEVRFGLTSESSLNDGLAFPFTHLAVLIGVYGFAPSEWWARWLFIDVGYRIVGGVVIGWIVGRILGRLVLRLVAKVGYTGEGRDGIAPTVIALAITLISYGACELAHAYGFIAVFVTAYVVRDMERENHVHDHLHEGAEQLEVLALSVVLLLLGAAFADALWTEVSWQMLVVAAVLVLVARPLMGWIGLVGHGDVTRAERAAISFFGIRGLGSIFYLAYGVNRMDLVDATALWALTAVTIFASLVVHGLTARPAMQWLDAGRETPRESMET